MNSIYCVVWSHARQAWVVVSEVVRRGGKGSRRNQRRRSARAVLAGLAGGLLLLPLHAGAAVPVRAAAQVSPAPVPHLPATAPAPAPVATPVLPATPRHDNPVGGTVVTGTGTIDQSGNLTTITQSSELLSLTWDSFDIGADSSVRFLQPDALSIAVNRILGADPSVILGKLDANGRVFLLNPNGVLFGEGARVNVGGLVASTLDFDDSQLGSDTLTFEGDSSAGVINRGTITTAEGGYVALLAHQVANQGVISARLGTVALAGGNAVVLNFEGGGLASVQVERSQVEALAANHELIVADGGQVLMSAGARDSLLASAVNNAGVVQARTVANREGRIILLGGMEAGSTIVDGTLDASAPDGGDGGFIETSAANIRIADSAGITTSAADGATGRWLIDPYDFTIAASGGDITGAALSAALESNDVTIQTTDTAAGCTGATCGAGDGTGNGDIFVQDGVTWAGGNTLALDAWNDIHLDASIGGTGGGLTLRAGGDITVDAAIDVGRFILESGNWIQVSAALPGFHATDFTLDGGIFLRAMGGDGSAANPYVLSDVYGLQGVGTLLAGNFALGNDIDASGTASWTAILGGAGFDPIGDGDAGFTGTFDGRGHVVSGLVIDRPRENHVALFGVNEGSIRRVGLQGGNASGDWYVGGLVGVNHGTITQSFATGTVEGVSRYVGGLVGENHGTITQSFATGTVEGVSRYVGGLVGENHGTIGQSYATGAVTGHHRAVGGLAGANDGTISRSYATGAVTGSQRAVGGLVGDNAGTIIHGYATGAVTGLDRNVGGLVGHNAVGTITQSYATGAVTGLDRNVGGLVGFNNVGGTVTHSYWNTETTGQATSHGGGELGPGCNAGGYCGLTTAELIAALPGGFDPDAWANAGNQSTPFLVGVAGNQVFNINDLPTTPVTSANRPNLYTVIQDVDQLQAIGNGPGERYLLGNDIDAGSTAGWNAGAGFDPVDAFTGTFDGLGHLISGLTIDRPGEGPVGLFGVNSGTIRNVGLSGGSVRGQSMVGGLVGFNIGAIEQSYATGVVDGESNVGGLAGANRGTIEQSHAAAAVTGEDTAGGLVGLNQGTITRSYATGAVTGADMVGGLVGVNRTSGAGPGSATITQSYATGTVTGADFVGGLVGHNDNGTITQSYATGVVTAANLFGGLVGVNSFGTVTQSYWDSGTTGQAASDGGTARTTKQLQSALPAGFDPSVWGIVPGQSYPYLLWQFAGETPQVVSGFVYNDAGATAAGAGLTVSGLVDGSAMVSAQTGGSVVTGANGYYYYLLAPGTLDAGSDVLAYVQASGAQPDGAALADNSGTHVAGLDIYGNTLHVLTASTALSTVGAGLLGAVGTDPAAAGLIAGLGTVHIDARGAFDFDVSDPLPGNLVVRSDTDDSGDGGITQSQAIVVAGTSDFDANTGVITLTEAGNDFGGAVSAKGRNIAISDLNALTLGTVTTHAGGHLSVMAGGSVLQTDWGALSISGTTDIAAGNAIDGFFDVALNNSGNDFGQAVSVSGGDIWLVDANDIVLGIVEANANADIRLSPSPGLLQVDANGTITDTAASRISVQGATQLRTTGLAFGIALDQGVHDFDFDGTGDFVNAYGHDIALSDQTSLVLGGVIATGDLAVAAGDGISQTSSEVVVTGKTRVKAAGDVALATASNDFGGAVDLVGATVRISDRNSLTLGTLDTGDLTVASHGALNLGSGDVNGSLHASSNDGTIGQSGALVVVGASSVDAGTGAIVLNDAANDFSGAVDLSGGTVQIRDQNALTVGLVQATGLTATSGGDLVLSTGLALDALTVAAGGAIDAQGVDVGSFTLVDGDWVQSGATLPGFQATDFRLQGGTFLRALGGDGSTGDPYLLTDVYGLQGVGTLLAGNFALANDIDAGGSAGWNGGAGFEPIGDLGAHFTGSFDGQGHSVDGLVIDGAFHAGLFGFNEGTIRNVGLTGGSVSGARAGGLVGQNDGTIANSYATGTVTGSTLAGGLVGINKGTIEHSFATAMVTRPGAAPGGAAGGLVGNLDGGTIRRSYATGTVDGDDSVGGLVGSMFGGTIGQSHATGAVTGGDSVGGLVGWVSAAGGTIEQSYATGSVAGDWAGGLVGILGAGTIEQSYATGAVTGARYLGGLAGQSRGTIAQSYATGAVTGDERVGGLAGYNDGTIAQSYATGAVKGDSDVGGLAGYNIGTIVRSYWNTDTSGQSSSAGGTGLSTAEMMDPESFAAWGADISATGGSSAVWRIYEGHTAPLLRAFMTDLAITADDVRVTYDGSDFAGSNAFTFGSIMPGWWHPGSAVDMALVLGLGLAVTDGAASDAGTYALDANPWSSQMGYDIEYIAGTLIIDPKSITVDATAFDKVYDGTTAATASLVANGVIAGDDIAFGHATATFDDKNAGTGKTVTVDGIAASGADAGNYSFNTSATDTADISQLAITVDATASDKVYDGTTAATTTLASAGVIAGDTVTFTGTGTFDDKNVGTGKTVTVDGIAASGADAGNYRFNTGATDTADITPATLTYVADPTVLFAGPAPDGLTGTVEGLVAGETLDEATEGTLAWTTSATAGSPAGSYGIEGGGLEADNYVFVQAPGNATALTLVHPGVPAEVTRLAVSLRPVPQDDDEDDGDTTGQAPDITVVEGGVRMP